MTHSAVLLTLDALACFRLTQLVIKDYVLDSARRWAVGAIPSSDRMLDGSKIPVARRPKVALFLSCPWCVSVWIAGGVVLMQSLLAGPWLYASAVLAFSAVAGIIAEHT